MSVSRVLGAIATFLCFFCMGVGSARGQGGVPPNEWETIGDLGYCTSPGPPPYSYTAIYFFSRVSGVEATSVNGSAGINYLVSSGPATGAWKSASIPTGISYIRQIRFIQGKLFAASQGTDALVSSDSGKSWTYSGLGLNGANDVYADGAGTIRMLRDPMKVFARLDTLHCIAQGDANIFVSNDGGLNWISSNVPMVDSFSTGAFADRCQNVYVCPNSWGTAWRSTNFGQTWQSVITGSGSGSEFLNGASTVIYITDTLGLFRSTDDGLTWNSVFTVDAGIHLPLFVFGPMGEQIVMPWFYAAPCGVTVNPIVMTTTGGLDDLHSGVNMTDSNGAPLMQQDTFNVPWELTSTCNPYLIPIAFWADVDGLSEKVTLSDSLGDFALLGPDSVALPRHREDTIWMQYDPHHPVANVNLTFENHWQCSDWTETRTVHVDAIPKALVTAPPVFVASCIPDTEAVLIDLDSCQTLCIDSVVIPSSITANFRLTTPLPDTASIGTNDSLLFAFTSSGANDTVSDSVLIYAHYLGLDSILDDYFYFPHAAGDDTNFSLFNTTVPVTLRSLPSGGVLSANVSALRVDTAGICEERDTFAILRNIGCDTVCVSGISLLGTGFIRVGSGRTVTPPFCLASGERDTVWLETQVDTSGHAVANNDTLLISSDAQPPLAPIILSREIQYPPKYSLALSPPDSADAGGSVTYQIIQHGTQASSTMLPPDDTSVDFELVYYDDLLTLDGVDEPWTNISGYYRSADGQAHYHFHISIPVGDSILATIHFLAYQARLLTTTLSLDSIQFASNPSRPSGCIASAALTNSAFTIRTSCGGPLLSDALNGILTIDGVSPNPTTGEVLLRYTLRGESVNGTIELEDALGRTVLEQTAPLVAAPNQRISLDLSDFPAGMYLARLEIPGAARSQRIIRQ